MLAGNRFTQVTSDILDKTASLIVSKPVLEVVQPGHVAPIATAATVAVEFNILQECLRSPLFPRFIEHAGHRQCNLKVCPAVEALQIGRRSLNVIIDLESFPEIGRVHEGHTNGSNSLRQWQRLEPISVGDHSIELFLALESLLEGKLRENFGRTKHGTREYHEGDRAMPDASFNSKKARLRDMTWRFHEREVLALFAVGPNCAASEN